MKKSILLLGLLVYCLTAFAQPTNRQEVREKIKEWRVAFFTEKLALSSDEAQKFWPIYYEKEKESKKLREDVRKGERIDLESLSDKEIEQLVLKRFDIKQRELDLQKKYFGKFKTAIPIKKIAQLPKIERAFKKMLVEKLKENRRGR